MAANLLLLAMSGLRGLESSNYRRQARQEAVSLLADEGIHVDIAALPSDPVLSIRSCERDLAREATLASALLGGAQEQSAGSYAGEKGRLSFHSSGDFSAEFTPDAYVLGNASLEGLSTEVMAKLDFQGEVLSVTPTEAGASVRLRQVWENTPIFSCEVTLSFEGDSLRSIRGRRLPGTPTAAAGNDAMSVTTVLIRFLSALNEGGYVRSEIRALTVGYEMTAMPTSGTFRLTPIWQIDTDASPFRLSRDGVLTQITE